MRFLIPILFVSQFAMADGPCKADREKLCGSVEKGGGAIMKCMKENEAQLSQECKDYRISKKAEMKEAMKDIHAACEADVESLCADVEKGKGRVMKCLKENRDKVSDTCKAELKEKKENRKRK